MPGVDAAVLRVRPQCLSNGVLALGTPLCLNHQGAGWPQAISEEPGAARGDPEEARKGVNGMKPEPTAQ